MIYCSWEYNPTEKISLRHVTVDAIVLDRKREKILLVKRSLKVSNSGKWALPGGYLDRNENTSEGALRELKEETGYEGKIISLFRVNDNPNRAGGDTQNVNFVYLVEAQDKTGEPDIESSETKWFSFKDLPEEKDFAFDHYENIMLYLKHWETRSSLPIFN